MNEEEPIPVAASTRRELETVREPDESFDDVLRRLLAEHESGDEDAPASALGGSPSVGSADEPAGTDDIVCPGCGRSFDTWGQLNVHQAGVDASHFEEL